MDFSILLEQVTKLVQGLTKKQKMVIGVATFAVIAFMVFLGTGFYKGDCRKRNHLDFFS
jgi:flagellar biosynthesis/type III secretory pathway M-ring protein FliF/YscJ